MEKLHMFLESFGCLALISIIIGILFIVISDIKERKLKLGRKSLRQKTFNVFKNTEQFKYDEKAKNEATIIANHIKNFNNDPKQPSFIKFVNIIPTDNKYIFDLEIITKTHNEMMVLYKNDICTNLNKQKNEFVQILKRYIFKSLDQNQFKALNDEIGIESFCVNLHESLFKSYINIHTRSIEDGLFFITYEPVNTGEMDDNDKFTIRFSIDLQETPEYFPLGRYYFGCMVGNELLINKVVRTVDDLCVNEYRYMDKSVIKELQNLKKYVLQYRNPLHNF